MRTAERRSHTGVIQRLIAHPQGFGFFQAVRLLELFFRRDRQARGDVVSQRIHFGSTLSGAFPPSEIESLSLHAPCTGSVDETAKTLLSGEKPAEIALDRIQTVRLIPSFFGLLGHQGALPAHYTERLAEREHYARDRAARNFLEIFSNRATALFYAAWKKYRLPLHYETGRHDTYLPVVMALAGYSPHGLRERSEYGEQGLHDEVAAHYAGILRHRPVSAMQMQRLLSDYFRVSVRVEQFVGHWYSVPVAQRTRLGFDQCLLGCTALCGGRVWQSNLRVRLWLGPLGREQYERFLPHGSARRALTQWLHMMTGDTLEYEVRPVLSKEAVSGIRLHAQSSARLGWDSFITTRTTNEDRTDISYSLTQLRKTGCPVSSAVHSR